MLKLGVEPSLAIRMWLVKPKASLCADCTTLRSAQRYGSQEAEPVTRSAGVQVPPHAAIVLPGSNRVTSVVSNRRGRSAAENGLPPLGDDQFAKLCSLIL